MESAATAVDMTWRGAMSTNNVIVYQFGRVGASALVQSLAPRFHAIQSHSYEEVREILRANPGRKYYVINMVRNFFDRNIAAYFENLDNRNHLLWCVGARDDALSLPMADFHGIFRSKSLFMLGLLENWYTHFNITLGIDIYARNFDHEAGFCRLSSDRFEILLLRYEDRSGWSKVISDFLDWPVPEILENDAPHGKWYAKLLDRFRKSYRFSPDEEAIIFNSRCMRHFYSKKELRAFRGKYA